MTASDNKGRPSQAAFAALEAGDDALVAQVYRQGGGTCRTVAPVVRPICGRLCQHRANRPH
jgi:hypothetical protein